MSELTSEKCEPCSGAVPALGEEGIQRLLPRLQAGWKISDDHHLTKDYRFKNFRQALDFTVRVGELAEREGHHPDICLSWGRVTLTVWTHAINGLSKNDFVLAAKADEALNRL